MSGSNTGVAVDSAGIQAFNDFKLKNTHRYIFYKISDDKKSVVVDCFGDLSTTYSQFLQILAKSDCRYVIYNFEYDTGADGKRSKIIFINWAPDTAPTKSKMLYAGTKGSFRQSMVGIGIEVQATDLSEAAESVVLDRCKSVSK